MRYLLYAAVPIIVTVYLFFQKIYYKRKLERGLGREVNDDELTSLTSWMKTSAEIDDRK